MKKIFRKEDGEKINLIEHTQSVLRKEPSTQVYVGTDSQNHNGSTHYVTVVAYRYNSRGVHFVYTRLRVKRQNDIWARLWEEAVYSVEVAQFLTANGIVVFAIDLDYNENKMEGSHKLLAGARGWCLGMGYKVNCKDPAHYFDNTTIDFLPAAKAADHIVRH